MTDQRAIQSSRLRLTLARLGILLLSIVATLGVAEVVLRWVGFSFSFAPQTVEFGWPDPVELDNLYVADPDLFWVPPDYTERLRGLREERPDIVFLGDSCTERRWGRYPAFVLEELRARASGRRIVGEELGVGGWSSFQGLQQLQRDVVPLRPRVVTVYFGWNDHWLGFGISDREMHRLGEKHSSYRHLRIAQLLLRARVALLPREREDWPYRVAPDEFRENLTRIVRLAREAGIVPVLFTAPSAHEPGREPPYLLERWMRDLGELVPLHQRYVEIVQDVAANEGAVLCDVAERFDAMPIAERQKRFFTEDGIHFVEAGDRQLAQFFLDCVESNAELRAALLSKAGGP